MNSKKELHSKTQSPASKYDHQLEESNSEKHLSLLVTNLNEKKHCIYFSSDFGTQKKFLKVQNMNV
jgi:hypothetical protein